MFHPRDRTREYIHYLSSVFYYNTAPTITGNIYREGHLHVHNSFIMRNKELKVNRLFKS